MPGLRQYGAGGGSEGGTAITHKVIRSANETNTTGDDESPGQLSGISLSIPAVADDNIEITLDVYVYHSSADAYAGIGFTAGITSLYRGRIRLGRLAGYFRITSTYTHTVAAGDLTAGEITCIPKLGVNSGTLTPLGATAKTYFSVKNLGPSA